MIVEEDDEVTAQARSLFNQAWIEHERYLSSGNITDELIETTIYLAQLDVIFRSGFVDENLGKAHREDVEDLRRLISIVEPERFRATNICLLNPTFGDASRLVGGADADLLIDEILIDIKTTKIFTLDRTAFNQLIGYFVLHTLGGIGDLTPKPRISRVAVYFSRHAHLETLDLCDIVDPGTFPAFLEWFSDRARQHSAVRPRAGRRGRANTPGGSRAH